MKERCACLLLILVVALASIQSAASAQTAEPKEEPAVKTVPDYSKLDLKGNGHTQDSFSLAVQSAAKLLGKEADYETIYCLSGNAFAPAIDKLEDCTAWWHVQGWQADQAMETVAEAMEKEATRQELANELGVIIEESKRLLKLIREKEAREAGRIFDPTTQPGPPEKN